MPAKDKTPPTAQINILMFLLICCFVFCRLSAIAGSRSKYWRLCQIKLRGSIFPLGGTILSSLFRPLYPPVEILYISSGPLLRSLFFLLAVIGKVVISKPPRDSL